MPSFTYKSIDVSGQDVTGQLDAPSRADVVRELATRGLCVTDVIESSTSAVPFLRGDDAVTRIRIRPKQLGALTRQLATSLEAGLPLLSALEVIGQELDHTPSRELLKQLRRRVQEGVSFSDALAEHPRNSRPESRPSSRAISRTAVSSEPSYRPGTSNCLIFTTSKALAPIDPKNPVVDAAAMRCSSVGSFCPARASRATG